MSLRHDSNTILAHPKRQAIYERIAQRPGVTFHELRTHLRLVPGFASLGHGSLEHHLYYLERLGRITSRRSGRSRRYYKNGLPHPGGPGALACLQAPSMLELARILLHEPGLSQAAIAQRLRPHRSWARQTLSYHLRRLEDEGLLTVTREHRWKLYAPSDLLARLVTSVYDLEPAPSWSFWTVTAAAPSATETTP